MVEGNFYLQMRLDKVLNCLTISEFVNYLADNASVLGGRIFIHKYLFIKIFRGSMPYKQGGAGSSPASPTIYAVWTQIAALSAGRHVKRCPANKRGFFVVPCAQKAALKRLWDAIVFANRGWVPSKDQLVHVS